MSKNTERVFAFYNLSFKTSSGKYRASLPPYSPEKHIEWLKGAFEEKRVYTFEKGRKSYYIQRLKEDATALVLLVKFLDGYARDHTLEDIQTHKARQIIKTASEGHAYTSHIYISKSPVGGKLKMIVESVNGFTLGKLSNALTGMLKSYLDKHRIFITVPDPSGEVKENKEATILKWPVIEARGTLSESFTQEIDNASIAEVNLISSTKRSANLENIEGLKEVKQVVKLSVSTDFKRVPLHVLQRLAGKNKSEYEEIVIRYKNLGQKETTAHLECDESLSPINVDRLVKKITINDTWAAVISDSYDDFVPEVLQAIERIKND